MLTQLGHVEVIKSIKADCDDSLCSVLLKNEYKEFDDGTIGKIFLQGFAKGDVVL